VNRQAHIVSLPVIVQRPGQLVTHEMALAMRTTAANRAHPDVLQLRWRMYADARKWDACLDIATALTTKTPERRFGWIHRAHALDKLGRTLEAKDLLLYHLTVLTNTDLSKVKGLESGIHHGPSSIGIDTFFRSGGRIPEVFLRGAGVPDTFIKYAVSLVGLPFEFYSCFISYSSKDKALAERLHADLQAQGVRCWFAPEQLKTGDKFRVAIDEAVRVYDKLLLLLSKHSVGSGWVEKEVETTFEKERKQRHAVLFPARSGWARSSGYFSFHTRCGWGLGVDLLQGLCD
jgi:TIR domain